MNILGRMDTATSGQVLVGDQEITGWSEKRLTEYRGEQVGFVFQFYNLIPNLNALENVEFATEVCKDHLDARDILHKVGLTDRMKNFLPSSLAANSNELRSQERLPRTPRFSSVTNPPVLWIM